MDRINLYNCIKSLDFLKRDNPEDISNKIKNLEICQNYYLLQKNNPVKLSLRGGIFYDPTNYYFINYLLDLIRENNILFIGDNIICQNIIDKLKVSNVDYFFINNSKDYKALILDKIEKRKIIIYSASYFNKLKNNKNIIFRNKFDKLFLNIQFNLDDKFVGKITNINYETCWIQTSFDMISLDDLTYHLKILCRNKNVSLPLFDASNTVAEIHNFLVNIQPDYPIINNNIIYIKFENNYLESFLNKLSLNKNFILDKLSRNVNIINNSTECPICFDENPKNGYIKTNCNHLFCSDCLLKNLSYRSVCALCNQKLNINQLNLTTKIKFSKYDKLHEILDKIEGSIIIFSRDNQEQEYIQQMDKKKNIMICNKSFNNKLDVIKKFNKKNGKKILTLKINNYKMCTLIEAIDVLIFFDKIDIINHYEIFGRNFLDKKTDNVQIFFLLYQ